MTCDLQAWVTRYSASDELLETETVVCFLDFQEIRAWQKKIQFPEVDLRVPSHPAQSESVKALSNLSDEEGKKNPALKAP